MDECDPWRIGYLPSGIVPIPNESGNDRVIWDTAAKVNGVSLKSMLLRGPDLLTVQLYVTCEFWECELSFSGGIQEMFLQVRIKRISEDFLTLS